MSNESKYERRFNPLEMSVDEAGGYVQRVPTCLFFYLCAEYPNSNKTAMVLFYIVMKALNLTYLSGKEETQAVRISNTELGKKLGTSQQRVSQCLKTLITDEWITNTNPKKCSTGTYVVNFDKVRKSARENYRKFGD